MSQQTSNNSELQEEHDLAIKLTQELARKLKDFEIKIQQKDQILEELIYSSKEMSRINDQKQERIQELDCQRVQMKQSFQSKIAQVQERIQKLVMADKEKEKMLEDQLTAIQVLETKVASMSETNIMNQMNKLKVKMNTCIEENHAT